MTDLLKFLLFLAILITPVSFPTKNLGFEEVKVILFIILMTLAGFLWLFKVKKVTPSSINKAALAFILSLTLTSLIGVNIKSSFLGESPYFQGLFLYSELFLFSIIISKTSLARQTIYKLMIIASLFVSLMAIKDAIAISLNIPIQTFPNL